MEKKRYDGTIVVAKEFVPKVFLAELYTEAERNCPDFEFDAPIFDYSLDFEDGFAVNAELWNAEPPWTDIVLFDAEGKQCAMLEPQDSYFGDHLIETETAEYLVHIVPEEGWERPSVRVAKVVPEEILNTVNRALAITNGTFPERDQYDTIETVTVEFPNGMQADIKCCNGDTPYVDPVLFDANGTELQTLDVEDDFLGEYWFEQGNVNMIVELTA